LDEDLWITTCSGGGVNGGGGDAETAAPEETTPNALSLASQLQGLAINPAQLSALGHMPSAWGGEAADEGMMNSYELPM